MSDQSPIVRLGGWIGVFFLWLTGPVAGYFMIRIFLVARASALWPTVPGELTHAGEGVTATGRYDADVSYSYSVSGVPYTGTKIRASDGEFEFRAGAEQQIEGLVAGQLVSIHYDPGDPGHSVLQAGAGYPEYALLLVPPAIFALGLFLLVGMIQTRDGTGRQAAPRLELGSIDRVDLA
jgi:hypothetical protein